MRSKKPPVSVIKGETEWTEIISPKRSFFDINLGEIWRYRDLVALFVRRDFVAIYKQTILGPLWLIIQPVLTTLIFFIVFTKVARLSTDGIPPILFYLSGVTLWTYFADCFSKTSNVFIANAAIFGKVYFPRLTTPLSIVISNLLKLVIQLALFFGLFTVYYLNGKLQLHFQWTIVLIPFLVFLMALLGLGLGIIFSSLTTKYRDLTFLLQFSVQLLMYATPVIYPLSSTGGHLRQVLMLNPLTGIIETFRYSLFGQGVFDPMLLFYCVAFTIVVLFVGIVIFNQVEKSFMDTV